MSVSHHVLLEAGFAPPVLVNHPQRRLEVYENSVRIYRGPAPLCEKNLLS